MVSIFDFMNIIYITESDDITGIDLIVDSDSSNDELIGLQRPTSHSMLPNLSSMKMK